MSRFRVQGCLGLGVVLSLGFSACERRPEPETPTVVFWLYRMSTGPRYSKATGSTFSEASTLAGFRVERLGSDLLGDVPVGSAFKVRGSGRNLKSQAADQKTLKTNRESKAL